MTDEIVRVTLALRRGIAPICGSLLDTAGHACPFAGWTELVGLLERASATRLDAGTHAGHDITPDRTTEDSTPERNAR